MMFSKCNLKEKINEFLKNISLILRWIKNVEYFLCFSQQKNLKNDDCKQKRTSSVERSKKRASGTNCIGKTHTKNAHIA